MRTQSVHRENHNIRMLREIGYFAIAASVIGCIMRIIVHLVIQEVDVVITMGCNIQCPGLHCSYREDWGLEDPTGKSDEVYLQTIDKIWQRISELKVRLQETP